MAKRMIEMALARPRSNSRNSTRYTRIGMVSVSRTGPPRVMAYTRSKFRSELMAMSDSTTVVTGRSSGTVTCRKICHRVAPSVWAASTRVVGMVARPAR